MENRLDADSGRQHRHDKRPGAGADVSGDLKRVVLGRGVRKAIRGGRLLRFSPDKGKPLVPQCQANPHVKGRRLGGAAAANQAGLFERQGSFEFLLQRKSILQQDVAIGPQGNHFGLQIHTVLLFYGASDQFDQGQDIAGLGLVEIQNKISVFLGYLGAADAGAF